MSRQEQRQKSFVLDKQFVNFANKSFGVAMVEGHASAPSWGIAVFVRGLIKLSLGDAHGNGKVLQKLSK